MRFRLFVAFMFMVAPFFNAFADNHDWCQKDGFDDLLKEFAQTYNLDPDRALHEIKTLNCAHPKNLEAIQRLSYVASFITQPPFKNDESRKPPAPWKIDANGQVSLDPAEKEKLLSAAAECIKPQGECSLKRLQGGQTFSLRMGHLFIKFTHFSGKYGIPITTPDYSFFESIKRFTTVTLMHWHLISQANEREKSSYHNVRNYLHQHKLSGIRIPFTEFGFDIRFPKYYYEIAQNLEDEGTSFNPEEQWLRTLDLYQSMKSIPTLKKKIQDIFDNYAELIYKTRLGDLKQDNVALGWGGISIVDFDGSGDPMNSLFQSAHRNYNSPLAHWSLFQGMAERLERAKNPDDTKIYTTKVIPFQEKMKLQDICQIRSLYTSEFKPKLSKCPTVSQTLDFYETLFSCRYSWDLKDYISSLSPEHLIELWTWLSQRQPIQRENLCARSIFTVLIETHSSDLRFLKLLLKQAELYNQDNLVEKRKRFLGLFDDFEVTNMKPKDFIGDHPEIRRELCKLSDESLTICKEGATEL